MLHQNIQYPSRATTNEYDHERQHPNSTPSTRQARTGPTQQSTHQAQARHQQSGALCGACHQNLAHQPGLGDRGGEGILPHRHPCRICRRASRQDSRRAPRKNHPARQAQEVGQGVSRRVHRQDRLTPPTGKESNPACRAKPEPVPTRPSRDLAAVLNAPSLDNARRPSGFNIPSTGRTTRPSHARQHSRFRAVQRTAERSLAQLQGMDQHHFRRIPKMCLTRYVRFFALRVTRCVTWPIGQAKSLRGRGSSLPSIPQK